MRKLYTIHAKSLVLTEVKRARLKCLIALFIALLIGFLGAIFLPIKKVPFKSQHKYFFIVDTFDVNKLDTAFLTAKVSEENVLIYLHILGASHPYESLAQLCWESTRLQDPDAVATNNYGGFMGSNGLIRYPHWTDFIRQYIIWQKTYGLKPGMDFYRWLSTVPYHETDPNYYNGKVRSIEYELRKKHKLKNIIQKSHVKSSNLGG